MSCSGIIQALRKREESCMLKIDVDYLPPKSWLREWIETRKTILESLGYKVKRIDIFKSSKRGFHAYIQLDRPIPPQTLNKLQFLCGDDPTRVKINNWRIQRGIKDWNVLYHRVLYRKKAKYLVRCEYCGNYIPIPEEWIKNAKKM